MPKLRNSIITQILDYLEYGDFCIEDFDAKFPDNTSILAKLTFKALPKYSFTLDETNSGGSVGSALVAMGQGNAEKIIRTIEQPGEYKNYESRVHDDIDSAIRRVSTWVYGIREDLIHSRSTVRTAIDDLTAEFQASIDEKIEHPEEYFKEEEQNELIKKLDELQKRIEALETEMDLDPKQTEKIEKAIQKSKSDVKIYPKGVWYKTAGTKLMKLLKEVLKTKEGRDLAADIVKKLIS